MSPSDLRFLPHFTDKPALGVLELDSIARGIQTIDAVMKKAPITMMMSRPVSGGKHIIMFRGGVAEVNECMAAGKDRSGDSLVDHLELHYTHTQIWSFLPEPVVSEDWGDGSEDSVGIIEIATVCSAILSADQAVKEAEVTLRDMRLALGISGKAFFTFTGELNQVDAAADAAQKAADKHFLHREIIPAPADTLRGRLFF